MDSGLISQENALTWKDAALTLMALALAGSALAMVRTTIALKQARDRATQLERAMATVGATIPPDPYAIHQVHRERG